MRILLIVDPSRRDFYAYLKTMKEIDFLLLFYVKANDAEVDLSTLPIPFKEIFYWENYKTASQLLEKVKPDKIVFFEIIDQRQIALIVAAKAKGIKTFYLEHGAAGDAITALARSESDKTFSYFFQRILATLLRFFDSFKDVLKVKLFYYASTKYVSARSKFRFLFLPIKTLFFNPNKALRMSIFPERVPGKCILFNEANAEEFALYTGVKKEDTILGGVPFFDTYYEMHQNLNDHIVFIDHPNLEEGLFNWTEEHHQQQATILDTFAKKNNTKLIIKLHPRSQKKRWDNYFKNNPNVEIIQDGQPVHQYLSAKLILAYSSSLLTALLSARKNCVLLAWHPIKNVFGADYSKFGICHLSYSSDELLTHYHYWLDNNLCIANQEDYNRFLQRFNYPFDGNATSRVINILKENT